MRKIASDRDERINAIARPGCFASTLRDDGGRETVDPPPTQNAKTAASQKYENSNYTRQRERDLDFLF